MRIMHIITDLDIGGAEMMLLKVVVGLNKRGHSQLVISIKGNNTLKEAIEKAGAEVQFLSLKHFIQVIKILRKIKAIQKTFAPDVIQSWMYHADAISAITKNREVPLVWNVRHSLDDYKNEKVVVRYLIRLGSILSYRATKILFNSEMSFVQHISKGFPQSKSIVIPNGFDTERFRPNLIVKEEKRKQFDIEDDDFVIGHIGRYHIVKNHKSLLEAISILETIGLSKKIVLLLSGRNVDENNIEIINYLRKISLKSRVILLGEISEPENIIPIFDMFCLSSFSEAFPNVLGEAMLCGIPCVSTDVGDARKIIGDTGIIAASSCSEDLSKAINDFISLSPRELSILGEKARQRIINNYSIEKVIDQYEQLYKSVIISDKI